MPFSDGVGFARRLAGDSRTRVPAEFADDSCGDGVLQGDGRRLPNGKRGASVLQDDCESTAAGGATQPISQILPSVAVVAEVVTDPVPSTLTGAAETHVGLGLPPPAPPGLHSILRI